MKRITRDKLYTEIAMLFSQRSTCKRLQVGCVITKDGRIIASGYNGPPKGFSHSSDNDGSCLCDITKPCTKSIHSEANAISFSARNGIKLEGTTMYCTHSPCVKCAELIIQSGVKSVIYIDEFRDIEGVVLLASNGVKVEKYNDAE